jgi:hypothetical protein
MKRSHGWNGANASTHTLLRAGATQPPALAQHDRVVHPCRFLADVSYCAVALDMSLIIFCWLQGGQNLLAGHTQQPSEPDCRRPMAPPPPVRHACFTLHVSHDVCSPEWLQGSSHWLFESLWPHPKT